MAPQLRHSCLITGLDEGVDNQAVDRHMDLWTSRGWTLQHFSTATDPKSYLLHFIWAKSS